MFWWDIGEKGYEAKATALTAGTGRGLIIVVIATDAPLLPHQCRRLAKRAAVGFARVGGVGHNGSGDLFMAFATGNHIPAKWEAPAEAQMLPHHHMNPLFSAVAEAVEEAIWNVLAAAETMTGFKGRMAYEAPMEELVEVWRAWKWIVGRGFKLRS